MSLQSFTSLVLFLPLAAPYDPPVPKRHPLHLMAASAVCFAVMALAAKLACLRLPGGEVAFVRFAVMLLPVALVPRLAREATRYERLDLLLYRGIFGGTAVLLYFLAIAHIPVGLATLFNYASPLWSVPFAAAFLDEPVDRRLVVPAAVALLGMALAATGGTVLGSFHLGRWEAVGIASSVLSGAALTAVRAARRTEGAWAIYGSFCFFGLAAAAPVALSGFVRPTAREWGLLLAVGVTSTVAQLLMTYAYRWVTNLEAGAISQLTVVLSLLLGVLLLGDRLTPLQLLGSALTVGGVLGVVGLQATPRAVE